MVLFLVAYYQKQIFKVYPFWIIITILIFTSIYGLSSYAPIQTISFGQLIGSCIIGNAALIPQICYNYSNLSKGDYSPITCTLSITGCSIRLFTTVILNNSDPILLLSFSIRI